MKILYFLLLPALTLGQQCSLVGECLGTSLNTEFVDSERECLEFCHSVEGCEWYGYDASIDYCMALKDCPEVKPDCLTCVHGENECDLNLMCFVPGECRGENLGHEVVPSADECLTLCYNDFECKFFSFYTVQNLCSMFTTCDLDETESDVVSGEKDCYEPKQATTKIFLQRNYDTAWMHMPSVHESGNGTDCSQPAAYPLNVFGSAAQVFDGSVTICSGNDGGYTKECFSLNAALNIWVEFTSIDAVRYRAASTITGSGDWWVTGGYELGEQSSTSLWNGSSWEAGPDLPTARYEHCVVQVSLSHTFMAGGIVAGDSVNDAYLFDWTAKVWTQLPDITEDRQGLACTFYTDGQGGEYILTAGGYPGSNSVQSYDLVNRRWETHPDLPIRMDSGSFVEDGDNIVLVSTDEDEPYLLRFIKSTGEFSIIDGQSVPLGEYGTVTLGVADSSLSGCN